MPSKQHTSKPRPLIASAIMTLALSCIAPVFGAPVAEAYPPVDVDMQVHRVPNSSAYYILGRPAIPSQANAGFTANAGFVVTDEGVVVYDAFGTPSLGRAMIHAIRGVTDKPIKYVVAGHYHADHIYGLQAFKDLTNAIVIAQDKAYLYIHSDTAPKRLTQRRKALAPWVNQYTRIVKPDVTFDDKLTIHLGDTRLKLIYAGPAHSPSDVMMIVQPAGILFAGDIVQNNRIPVLYADEPNTKNWLDALSAVRKLKPRFIIPGHGQPSSKAVEAIKFTQHYIRYLRTQMHEAVKSWLSFEEAYKRADWSPFQDLPAFDAINKQNAYGVYLEMEKAMFK